MNQALTLAAVLLCFSWGGPALAQQETKQEPKQETKILPGLWEHRFTVKTESGLLEGAMSQLGALAPNQQALMEQMMAARGVSLGPKGNTLQVCISPEDAARGEVPQMDSDCTQQVLQNSGNTIRVRFNCATDPPASGEGEITFLSPKAYTGKAVVYTTVHGLSEQMNIEQQGQWLAADCGGIKPLGQ